MRNKWTVSQRKAPAFRSPAKMPSFPRPLPAIVTGLSLNFVSGGRNIWPPGLLIDNGVDWNASETSPQYAALP